MNKYVYLLALSIASYVYSQGDTKKCATQLLEMKAGKASLQQRLQFESALQKVISARKAFKTADYDLVTIPVVVHILHPNLPIGVKQNLSDEVIKSQIEVLNRDFRRLNKDTTQTLPTFKSIAGDSKIQFCLATVDPLCYATTGIVRNGTAKPSYTLERLDTLKALSHWPSDQYLNIWITDMEEGFIGYAKFPYGTSLPGMSESEQNKDPRYDGVVIDYKAFGTLGPSLHQKYFLGRTTTHEIGHWLGLLHIWGGESGCESDYCEDTPVQESSTTGCQRRSSCDFTNQTMMENYMDYTNDECMNMFSKDQIDRMRAALVLSDRRKKLVDNNMCAKLPDPTFVLQHETFEVDGIKPFIHLGSASELSDHGAYEASAHSIKTTLDSSATVFTTDLLVLDQPLINYINFDLAMMQLGGTKPQGKLLVSYSYGCSGIWNTLSFFSAAELLNTNKPDRLSKDSWQNLTLDLSKVKKTPVKLKFEYLHTVAAPAQLYLDNLLFSEKGKNTLDLWYDYSKHILVIDPLHIGLKDLEFKVYSSEGKHLFTKSYSQIPASSIKVGDLVTAHGVYIVKVVYDQKVYTYKFVGTEP